MKSGRYEVRYVVGCLLIVSGTKNGGIPPSLHSGLRLTAMTFVMCLLAALALERNGATLDMLGRILRLLSRGSNGGEPAAFP